MQEYDWLSPFAKTDLRNIVPTTKQEYAIMHPKDMRITLDKVTSAISKATIGRHKMSHVQWILHWEQVFMEFSQWSHIFNKELRKLIAETENEKDEDLINLNIKYKYVYSFWWNRFHYISTILASKSRMAGVSVKKGLERGRNTLAKLIDDKADFNQLHQDFQNFISNHQNFDFSDAIQNIINKNKKDK